MGFILQDGRTPLVSASQNGYLEIVKSLMEAGANVNHTTKVVRIHLPPYVHLFMCNVSFLTYTGLRCRQLYFMMVGVH